MDFLLHSSLRSATGLDDMRSVGNVSLTVAIVSAIYMVIFFTGGPVLEDGKQLVAKSNFFALACAGYTVLTLEVWLNAYGKSLPRGLRGHS